VSDTKYEYIFDQNSNISSTYFWNLTR